MSDLVAVYEAGDEDVRMVTASNRVEWERTLELLERWLPPAPARVLDIGGGPGRYAAWLAERGYTVQLLDPVPKHVRQARARGVAASEGDARALPYCDEAADAVLMLGPLYHLPSASDRALALTEAVRCAAPGAPIVVAAMSRWAKPAVKTSMGELGDPAVRGYLLRVLAHGHDVEGNASHFSIHLMARGIKKGGSVEPTTPRTERQRGAFSRPGTGWDWSALRKADRGPVTDRLPGASAQVLLRRPGGPISHTTCWGCA